jgi:hypothetical protein
MKNKIKIISLVALGAFIFTTCQKDPELPMPDLQMTVIPKVTKDLSKDQNISFVNLTAFSAAVVVDLYFKDQPQSMNLMVIMNDKQDQVAVVKSDITSFPTSVGFTINNLVDLIPGLDNISQLKLGDYFRFYVDISLKDGTVIKGYDPAYKSFTSNVANLPGSSLNVVFNVACPLDKALTVGSYLAYSPPSDWNSTGNITLTADAADPYKIYVKGLAIIDGENEDKGPLVMHINPLTYAVTADKTVIDSDFYGFTNYYFSGTGTYDTCTGKYTMQFEIGADGGNWGSAFNYTFTRN